MRHFFPLVFLLSLYATTSLRVPTFEVPTRTNRMFVIHKVILHTLCQLHHFLTNFKHITPLSFNLQAQHYKSWRNAPLWAYSSFTRMKFNIVMNITHQWSSKVVPLVQIQQFLSILEILIMRHEKIQLDFELILGCKHSKRN